MINERASLPPTISRQELMAMYNTDEAGLQRMARMMGDPGGNAVRQAAQPVAAGPMIPVSMGPGMTTLMPNMDWGRANGMQWDGAKWVPMDPNRDFKLQMEREQMKMDMKRREEEMAQERWRRAQEQTATNWAMNQQMNPSAQLAPMPTQRPSAALTPGQPDQLPPEERLAHNRQMVEMYQKQAAEQAARAKMNRPGYGAAQPVQPPSQGTPYAPPAQQSPAQPSNMEWWHNADLQQEIQAPPTWAAPPGWAKGRLGEGQPPKYPIGPGGGQWMGGLRAKPKPGEQQPNYPKGPNGGALLPDGREVYL